MNIGVILRLPSDVRVSICLLIGAFAGVFDAEFTVWTLLEFGDMDNGKGSFGAVGVFKSRSSGASMTVQPVWANNFPYNRSWRLLCKMNLLLTREISIFLIFIYGALLVYSIDFI